MTKEELLKDPWVAENYGDKNHPNYINSAFLDGVDYGERKAIEQAVEWMKTHRFWWVGKFNDLIRDFKKAMEGE